VNRWTAFRRFRYYEDNLTICHVLIYHRRGTISERIS
jgi:hypothetical protein